MNQIDQAMRLQTRKRDARQIEGIDPKVFFQACATRVFRHKMTVERGIMRNERGVAHETCELLARLNGRGRIGDIGIARGFGIDNHDIAVEVTVVGMQSLRF